MNHSDSHNNIHSNNNDSNTDHNNSIQNDSSQTLRKHINEIIYHVSRYIEIILSIIILLVIALAGIRLIHEVLNTSILSMDTEFFNSFLSQALSLVVGVEFVKMLCQHSALTVVEVLMFATARHMVVQHLTLTETLIGVISIAILFAIRKYLMTDNDDMNPHHLKENQEAPNSVDKNTQTKQHN